MLHRRIVEFIKQIKELNAVGCILVMERSKNDLIGWLDKAGVIIGEGGGRVSYCVVEKNAKPGAVKPPAVLIVTEEDYSSDKTLAERIRQQASYFLNVV